LIFAWQQLLAPSIPEFQPFQAQIVDALMILANCFAIWCCVGAVLMHRGVSRNFWLLFAGMLILQLCGNAGWAFVRYFHVLLPDAAMFPSLFYRLYAGPMAIALFLSEDFRSSRFRSFLDGCIVVGLVGLTMYQVQMAELGAHDAKIWQSISITSAVNTLLLLVAVVRLLLCTPGCLRGLFVRQVVYLSTYYCVSVLTSVADAYWPRVSEWASLLWISTYLMAAGLAATWRPPADEQAHHPPKISRRTSLLCFNLTLATLVLASAILGLRLVNSTRVVGLVGVGVVLFAFAIRSALMQDAQERTLVELQANRAELRRQALYDHLTTLPNRRLLSDRLSQALAGAKRDGINAALLFLDLDAFKQINDILGHAIGDLVLIEVARRLRLRVRESDTVARMGGDEFTVLMTRVTNRNDIQQLAKAVLQSLGEPFQVGGHTITVTVSVGIAVFPDDASDPASLLEHADVAMYAVKRRGKNGIEYFTPECAAGRVEAPGPELFDAVD
jgi:diguanylate cyclase (GGDEF)-like protein